MCLLNKKRIAAVILALVLAFGLAACGQVTQTPAQAAEPAQEEPKEPPAIIKTIKKAETDRKTNTDWARGNIVKKADEGRYLRENNIEVITVNAHDDKQNNDSNYVKISGLKDREVEEKINAEIFAAYKENSNWDEDHLPQVRGLALKANEYDLSSPGYTYTYTNVGFNCAGILSVCMRSNASFHLKGEDLEYGDMYLAKTTCLNFDLNTGKQVKLADTVIDGKGLDYFNEQIEARLVKSDTMEEGYYSWFQDDIWFKQAGEFPGLKEDQQFYIDSYSGDVVLVFDWRTPWMENSSNGAGEISCSISPVSALAQRFDKGMSIFRDEIPAYRLLSYGRSDDASDQVRIDEYDDDLDGIPVYSYRSYTYYKDMPQGQLDYLFGDEERVKEMQDEMIAVYKDFAADKDASIYGTIDRHGYASTIGRFTVVQSGAYVSIYDNINWRDLYSNNISNSYVFDGDSSVPMKYEDLFKAGKDAKALTVAAMLKGFDRNEYIYYDASIMERRKNVPRDRLKEFAELLYDNRAGFTISTDRVNLTIDQDVLRELVFEYFPEFSTWEITSGLTDPLYRDIGCRNLTIF